MMKTKLISRGVVCYGPLTVASLYFTWIVARLALGRWPQDMADDPQTIAWGIPFMLMILPSLAWPVVVTAGLLVAGHAWYARKEEWKTRIAEVFFGLTLFAGSVWFIRWDPLE